MRLTPPRRAQANPTALTPPPAPAQYALRIQDAPAGTGLGVFALEDIPHGVLLSDYTGELTTRAESDAREAAGYSAAGLCYTWCAR